MSPMSAPAAKARSDPRIRMHLISGSSSKASAAAANLDINSGLSAFSTLGRCNCNTQRVPHFSQSTVQGWLRSCPRGYAPKAVSSILEYLVLPILGFVILYLLVLRSVYRAVVRPPECVKDGLWAVDCLWIPITLGVPWSEVEGLDSAWILKVVAP